jgi:hypothetical protein
VLIGALLPGTTALAAPKVLTMTSVATDLPIVTLRLTTLPWGNVVLDGVDLGRTTPLVTHITRGHHVVEVRRPECCESYRAEFDAEARGEDTELRGMLLPKPATLSLRVGGPSDVLVVVNGFVRGLLSDFEGKPLLIPMPPGSEGKPRYRAELMLELTRDGYQTQRIPLRLAAGELQVVYAQMVPEY